MNFSPWLIDSWGVEICKNEKEQNIALLVLEFPEKMSLHGNDIFENMMNKVLIFSKSNAFSYEKKSI